VTLFFFGNAGFDCFASLLRSWHALDDTEYQISPVRAPRLASTIIEQAAALSNICGLTGAGCMATDNLDLVGVAFATL
jgi:hypothetical protein